MLVTICFLFTIPTNSKSGPRLISISSEIKLQILIATQHLENKWKIDSNLEQNKQVASFTDLLLIELSLVSLLLFVRRQEKKTYTQAGHEFSQQCVQNQVLHPYEAMAIAA